MRSPACSGAILVTGYEMEYDRLYITFDIDWVDDDVLAFVLDLLDQHGCKATFFVTHDSPLIRQMKDDVRIERGIHPNFTSLLNAPADAHQLTAAHILADLKAIVPEAVSCRSHSLVSGTPFLRLFRRRGLLIDSNTYIPCREVLCIRPWRFWTDTLLVPFIWSDYIDLLHHGDAEAARVLRAADTVRVVAFHPIHVYLNIRTPDQYAQFKRSGLTPKQARSRMQSRGTGAGDVLLRLLSAAAAKNVQTGLLRDLLDE
jgi:hypothetical protein